MKIGLDYGGVMDNNPESWINVVQCLIDKGHKVYLLSHAHPGKDHEKRYAFCFASGAIDLSFSDIMNENDIAKRKAQLVKEHNIELVVEDYMNRCITIHNENPLCGFICIHYSQQELTRKLLDGLTTQYA